MSAQPVPGVVTGPIIMRLDEPEEGEEGASFYQLVAPNGEEGPIVEFGLPATLHVSGLTYMAFLDEDGEPDEDIGPGVYMLAEIESAEEEVDFGIPEEEEEPGADGDSSKGEE